MSKIQDVELKRNGLVDGKLLNEIRLLRQQKGKYLCTDFCGALEKVSCKLTKIIWQLVGLKRIVSAPYPNPTKIYDNTVDICLECIESDLQKMQPVCSPHTLRSKYVTTLISISDDLRILVFYIKCTISTDTAIYLTERTDCLLDNLY